MSVVEFEMRDNVGWIYLNRPHRLNAVTPELVEGLCNALERALQSEVRAVVISGRGRAFCAGHDLKSGNEQVDSHRRDRQLERIQDVTRLVQTLPCPVIAAVHGYALGAGCEFALCADLIVADDEAIFGFPEVEVGLSVTGGISHILPIAVGKAKAKELLLLGEKFGASRAEQLGLVNWVVPQGELEEATAKLVNRLIARPRVAMQLAKTGIDRSSGEGIENAMEREIRYTAATMASTEASDAARLFRAGRSPDADSVGE